VFEGWLVRVLAGILPILTDLFCDCYHFLLANAVTDLKQCHGSFPPPISQLIIRYHPIVRRHTARVTDSVSKQSQVIALLSVGDSGALLLP
jgi:hypothetical protein